MTKHLIILLGNSGTGKNTVANILENDFNVPRVVTHTTRKKRNNEVEGIQYYFENEDSIKKLNLIESTVYDGNIYGSSVESLNKIWKNNDFASIILDYKGIESYLKVLGPEKIIIIHLKNNPEILRQRLEKRGDNTSDINHRVLFESNIASINNKLLEKIKDEQNVQVFTLQNDKEKEINQVMKKF